MLAGNNIGQILFLTYEETLRTNIEGLFRYSSAQVSLYVLPRIYIYI